MILLLQEAGSQPRQFPEQDGLHTPVSEQFRRPSLSVAESSYDGGSSRDERSEIFLTLKEHTTDLWTSREQSQPALAYQAPEHAVDGVSPFSYTETNELSKFSFECAYYRRTKREMLANGWDEAQIFGRNDVDVDTLLLGFADPQESLPVPTWAAKTMNRILPAAPLPIRLAFTYTLTKMMRVCFGRPRRLRDSRC